MADLKMLHYKQIQYEFCSKEHIFFFTRQQHNATYDTDAQFFVHVLYNNGKILGPDESTDYNHSL